MFEIEIETPLKKLANNIYCLDSMSEGLEITLFKFLFKYSNPSEAADKDFLLAFLLHVDSKIWHSESSPVEIVISSGKLIEISGSKIISRLILFDSIEYLLPFFLSQIVENGVISAPVPAVEGMHIIFDFSEILFSLVF